MRFSNRYLVAAATLLIFMGLGLLLWKYRSDQTPAEPLIDYVEVFADPGKLKHIVLPDSSTIWLNAGSKLRFPVPFDVDSTRRVYLRSEEHTSELQSLMRISYAVLCLKKKIQIHNTSTE